MHKSIYPLGFVQKIWFALLIIGCLSLFQFTGYAQKVGLVLSGGGTKGTAHIGVIKALEEEGIPIDYITGTSMGAIIGGLYAAGYSPDEMYSIIASPAFSRWATGEIEDKYYYYFKKAEPDASWATLKFKLDSTITHTLPSSLVSPVQMDFAVMEYFAQASALSQYNFDSLFIPFRCIASDIASNRMVVLKQGDLGQAIRASMTFPFYFRPIRIDGVLMLDGGMYNNFPSDVMYEDFFPDIIIGSKVVSNYAPPDEDDIISQLQTVFMESTEYSVVCDNGVLIEPVLPQVNLIDFSRVSEFVDSGYVAAKRSIAEIRGFVFKTRSAEELKARRKVFNDLLPPVSIDSIHILGVNAKQAEYVRRSFARKDSVLNLEAVRQEYYKLIADDKISRVSPRLKYNDEEGHYDLVLEIQRDKDFHLSFGGNISSSPINEAFVEIQYKYLGKQAVTAGANSYIGRFYSSTAIKTRVDFPRQYPLYLGLSLTLSQYDFFKTSTYFFEDKTPSYLIKNENNIVLQMGIPVTNQGKFELSIGKGLDSYDYYQTNFFTRIDTADRTSFDYSVASIVLDVNTLNRKQFANKGSRVSIQAAFIMGNEDYTPGSTSLHKDLHTAYHKRFLFRLQSENYWSINSYYTIGAYADAVVSDYKFFKTYTATMLASHRFEPIPESRTLFLPDYRAHNFLGGGVRNIFSLLKNVDLRLEAYLFTPFQGIFQEEDKSPAYGTPFVSLYHIGSAALVYHSPIGPVSLNLNYYERREEKWSLNFNIGYILFNRHPLQ